MSNPKPRAWWLTNFLVPLLLLISSGMAFYALGARPEQKRKTTTKPQGLLVDVAQVESIGNELIIETTGEVVPHREIIIATEVGGKVVRKNEKLRVGEFVRQGELLVEIDPERYDLDKSRLETIRDQAESDLTQVALDEENLAGLIELAKESHELSMENLKRVEDLRSQNVSTDVDYDAAQRAELNSRDTLQRLQNDHRNIDSQRTRLTLARDLAAIQLKQAELDLRNTVLTAPVSGIVTATHIEDHSVLKAGDQVAVIEDTSVGEVHCHLTMDEMYWVWNHRPERQNGPVPPAARPPRAELDMQERSRSLPAIPTSVVFAVGGEEFAWDGILARIDGAGLDSDSRTVPCRVVVPEPLRDATKRRGPKALMRGMFVSCRIRTTPRQALLKVPEKAIRPGNEAWLMKDGKLQVASVRIVRVADGMAVIDGNQQGVTAGDTVITSPVPDAREGLSVVNAASAPLPAKGAGKKRPDGQSGPTGDRPRRKDKGGSK